jgi:long-chain acyl-CoA synthetase
MAANPKQFPKCRSGVSLVLSHLYELVRQRSQAFPDAIALGGQEGLIWRTFTSRQLLAAVDRLAAELAEAGVGDGDRVVLWLPNHWRTPVFLFALWKLGAVAVPFDREMNPDAGARILDSISPRLIITGYGERPAWSQGRDLTGWWEPGTRGGSDTPEPWQRPSEELAAIFFTSGTTGDPKGCMISHANLCSQVEALRYTIPLDVNSRLASILPLSHLFELTVGLLYPLSAGAAIHYIPSRRGPDIARVLAEQRITHMIAVPQLLALMGHALDDQLRAKLPAPVYRALNNVAEHLPLAARHRLFWIAHRKIGGRLRMIASGGAALPAETQRLWERLGVRIVQGYGASECSPVIACGAGDGSTPIGSVGRPLRGVEARLSAEGELSVRGPNVMSGYWNDPARTDDVLKDGWYATGDLATIDAAGNISLAGRAKDLIVLPSGMNVWPQDVEDALRTNPAVADAAVIAVPATSGGATLHAYLLPAPFAARSADLGRLVAECNGRLAQHQRIASASWWQEADFPRTAIGKVRRNLLPLPESTGTVKIEATRSTDDPVGQAVAGVARVQSVQDDQTLATLGLDSFGIVELSLALEEKTGRAVGDGDISTDMTVAQVRAMVTQLPEADEAGEPRQVGEAGPGEQPVWPYTWGRIFRTLAFPFDVLYAFGVTKTTVLGGEHLDGLPPRVVFAGTHHSFADMPLVRHALSRTPARRFARSLVVAAAASEYTRGGVAAEYVRLAFGVYPLEQRRERDASLRGLVRLAGAGNAVLIFPQGAHVKPELERAGDPRAAFKPGVAHLAEALGAAVIPFGLAGTERLMPADLSVYHGPVVGGIPVSITRGPLAIAFGEPLRFEPDEDPHLFAERLQASCFTLARAAEAALEKEGQRR